MVRFPYACGLAFGLALLALSTAAAEPDKTQALQDVVVWQGQPFVPNQGTTYIGELRLKPGAQIFTNGFPVKLVIELLIIEDTAQLISPGPSQATMGESSGLVELVVQNVEGKGLSILNAGVAGAPGSNAPPRDPSACAADAAASAGNPGGPGQNGGDAANVSIVTSSQSAWAAFSVLTDTNAAGQPQNCGGQICGGLGGLGGAGGAGVPVKPAFDSKALGPDGPPGATGSTGRNGKVSFNWSVAMPERSRPDSLTASRRE